jgi:hypothetical protein
VTRYWQVTLRKGEVTRVLGVEGDTSTEALRTLGRRVGFAWLGGAAMEVREIIPPDERKPGEERAARCPC